MKTNTIFPATKEAVAPGFTVRRGLPVFGLESVGPFLFLDHMGPIDLKPGESQGVPDHPHKGFQTVTYIIDGFVEHKDSRGNRGTVGPGEMQWMTAGSGIVHSEFITPAQRELGGRLHGFQIWVNLPMQHKNANPGYQQFAADLFPVALRDNGKAKIKLLAGALGNEASPIETYSPLFLFHVSLEAGATVTLPVSATMESAVYVADGTVRVNNSEPVSGGTTVSNGEASEVTLLAETKTELLFFGGKPLNEPVASYGPFVMNYPAEIRQAIMDYQEGKFGTIEA